MAIHLANLGTDMLTNPISCSIVHRSVWICDSSHYEPWHKYVYIAAWSNPGQLRTAQSMDSMEIHIANLGADMFTNPISCSIVHKMHGFYGNSLCKPWHRHAYKPYQLFNCA